MYKQLKWIPKKKKRKRKDVFNLFPIFALFDDFCDGILISAVSSHNCYLDFMWNNSSFLNWGSLIFMFYAQMFPKMVSWFLQSCLSTVITPNLSPIVIYFPHLVRRKNSTNGTTSVEKSSYPTQSQLGTNTLQVWIIKYNLNMSNYRGLAFISVFQHLMLISYCSIFYQTKRARNYIFLG